MLKVETLEQHPATYTMAPLAEAPCPHPADSPPCQTAGSTACTFPTQDWVRRWARERAQYPGHRRGEPSAAGHLYLRGWAPAPEGCPKGRRCPRCWSARQPPPTDAPGNTHKLFNTHMNKCPINVHYNFIFAIVVFLVIFQFGNLHLSVYTEEHWHPVIYWSYIWSYILTLTLTLTCGKKTRKWHLTEM